VRICKDCKRHESVVGRLSKSGLCPECAVRRMQANWQRIRLESARLRERWEAERSRTYTLEEVMQELASGQDADRDN